MPPSRTASLAILVHKRSQFSELRSWGCRPRASGSSGLPDHPDHQYDHPKPYQARVYRGGSFATAEEAALCVARSREGGEEQGQEDREEEQEKEQEESFHFAGSKSFI